MKVTLVPIDSIRPYENNANIHPPEQVAALAKEISEVGWTQNIVVDHDGVIVVGHGRRLAALQLGLEKVPVHRLPADLSPERVRAIRLFDNRIADSAKTDEKLLAAELAALAELPQFDVGWTGFTVPELLDLLPDDNVWVQAHERKVTPLGEMPDLPEGGRPAIRSLTLTLHESQEATYQEAIAAAKAIDWEDDEETRNQSSNGNAIIRICRQWLQAQKA
jgi:hypothetical protein